MHTIKKILLPLVTLLFLISISDLTAQDSTKSLAFKKNRPQRNNLYFYQPDLSYQLLQNFKLMQIANSGDPLAQHELGLRLLMGEGIAADTNLAVYWIKKAAAQKLTSALYNYGIMLINGWGTEWDPFAAYENFLFAAESGMSQAQYVVGILNTDNLIVPRNFNNSYYWLKKSSDAGYEPAKEVLDEISTKVSPMFKDSVNQNKFLIDKSTANKQDNDNSKIKPSAGLVFIDFDMQTDTIKDISDKLLVNDLERISIPVLDSLRINNDSTFSFLSDAVKLKLLRALAESGSPEALSILGRLYERGDYVGKNKINAAEYYIRATILDSPRATFLLWKLIREKDFYTILNDAIQFNDPSAQFVWYGLKKLGYDNRLTDADAIDLLKKASLQNHLPSIIELGLNYYTGKFVNLDKKKGLSIWESVKNSGSIEPEIRLVVSKIFDSVLLEAENNYISVLTSAEEKGSLLAQFALGYCYENGIGVKQNIAAAVKYFRLSAQRGNQFAYEQLKRLYDSKRPASEKFKVN